MRIEILTLFSLILLSSCASKPNVDGDDSQSTESDSIFYAKGFALRHGPSASVTIDVFNPWQGATHVRQSYQLVPRAKLSDSTNLTQIPVPIERAVCMSTSHVAFFSAINQNKVVKGISGTNYVYNKQIAQKIDSGLIKEIGYEQTLNYELIASLRPDVVLCYSVDQAEMASLRKLNELGIRTMLIGEYLEDHPLGKTEWLKVFGALTASEDVADSIFNSVKTKYLGIVKKQQSNPKRPKVFLNLPFNDIWYTPSNQSYLIKLVRDAGGDYPFAHLNGNQSYPISFERAYEAGLQADIWLNPGTASTLKQIAEQDPRLKKLQPFKNGRVFNNNARTTINGGSDFWESGAVYPNLILDDLIKIMHNTQVPDNELHYFHQLK